MGCIIYSWCICLLGVNSHGTFLSEIYMGLCLLYLQKTVATSWGEERLDTESTDNQTDRGHTQWGTLGHLQKYAYIQRTQTARQTWAHWGTVYCTYSTNDSLMLTRTH